MASPLKIILIIDRNTNQGSNHLSYDSHYDILTTALKTDVVKKGDECGDHREQHFTRSSFSIFLLTV